MYRGIFQILKNWAIGPMPLKAIVVALLTFTGGTSALISPVAAQSEKDENEILPMSGEAAFAHYCAPCHGSDGRGEGPKVFGLSRSPPDLTKLTARNGGTFPREPIARVIDGREQVNAHSREMPLWGEWFKLEAEEGFEGEAGDEGKIRKRIDDLLDFLESIQE